MTEGESGEHPKWLLELENRRRKPRLAHEAGAGAPCVICNVACPGLDLHFWRKICKNCKCSKDDHDIDDEDFPQFNLLLGTSRKYKKKPILLHINKEKEQAEETFEWVPPNTTEELAADYMKALPVERLPIKGSAGAALRRQLLHKQLPLHDIDYKTCDELTDQEKKQFEKYLENIKKLVGQATVIKALSARPYDGSLVTPINATDMQKFSPINKSTVHSSMVHLRTPSSFAPKCSYKQSSYDKASFQNPAGLSTEPGNNSYLVENIPTVEKYNIDKCNIDVVKSEPVVNGLRGIGPNTNSNNRNVSKQMATDKNLKPLSDAIGASLQTALPVNLCESYKEAYKDILNSPSNALLNSASVNDENHMAEAMLADALLPPSTVHASDIIGSTLDEKGLSYIREKLTNKYSNQENIHPQFGAPCHVNSIYKNNVPRLNGKETGNATFVAAENELPVIDQPQTQNQTVEKCKPAEAEKAAIKPNSSNVIHSYPTNSMQPLSTAKLLAASTNADNSFSPSQPRHQAQLNSFATPSTVIHSEKLQSQVFPYENAAIVKTCDNGPFNPEYLKGALQELTIDTMKPQKCHKCAEEIRVGDVAIVAEKAKNAMWHPGCFVCNVCDELLVDLVYFYYKNKLYCGRDLATLLGIPRCFACDELIFVREYTVAEGHNYHVKHFCCWDCDIPLAGKQYITENDRPLCLICYQKTYAKTCDTCEKVIAADQQGVAVKDLNFHATGNCFCCYVCHQNLLNGRFAVKERRVLCSKECISKYLNMQNT